MKIRTQETVQYYEDWEYTVDSLPEGFDYWNRDDQFSWLSSNCTDATKLKSFPADLGSVDEYEVVNED